MIKVDRSYPAPQSLLKRKQYDGKDVVDQLFHDFHNKCYICGIKPLQDPQIEHLRPHKNGKFLERKYDWENLFLSCGHCNSIKNQSLYDETIMDCCQKDPEKFINFELIDGNVSVHAKDHNDLEAVMTAQLVMEVFNKSNTGMRVYKSQLRLNELYYEMNVLFDVLEKYNQNQQNNVVKKTLKALLKRSSQFAEFKRNYIRLHDKEYPELMIYID